MILFTLTYVDEKTNARNGNLQLNHGGVRTPAFMPVGTNGTVKAMHHDTIETLGYKMVLSNTYHLYLRPGIDVIRAAGGLHPFSGITTNILTDSGGFQVFSLSGMRKLTDQGVSFQSHIDGSRHFLSPETVVDLQLGFGSDILMQLDVCTRPDTEYHEAVKALELTTSWAKRSMAQWRTGEPINQEIGKGALFGIIQGNFFKDLRKRSAEEILDIGFPGIAVGGLSVGERSEVFQEFLEYTATFLPSDLPRYVMGIGTPDYILYAVEQGIDIFDCVFATRIARNGTVFTDRGTIALKKERYAMDFSPIDERCGCRTCRKFSRAYIRHLFKTKEILGPMLTTEHNLYYLYNFMENIRKSIENGRFSAFKSDYLENYIGSSSER